VILISTNCKSRISGDSKAPELSHKIVGHWLSSDKNYIADEENYRHKTIVYFGPIKNKIGEYRQNEKVEKYYIDSIVEKNNTIEVILIFSNGIERKEKLVLTNNYRNVENIIVTPDGVLITTYFVKYDKKKK